MWCGIADGIKYLIVYSGSRDGVSRWLSVYCEPAVSKAKGDGALAVTEMVGEGSKWLNCRLVIEPTRDLGTVSSSYLRQRRD